MYIDRIYKHNVDRSKSHKCYGTLRRHVEHSFVLIKGCLCMMQNEYRGQYCADDNDLIIQFKVLF